MDPAVLRLLGVLEQLQEQKGVPKQTNIVNKNINPAEGSSLSDEKKETSAISQNQKRKLVETFNLFNQMFFDYQKKTMVDEKEKTKIANIANIARKQATPPPLPEKGKDAGSLLSTIMAGVGVLAASIGAIIASVMGFFGDVGGKVMTAFGKLGLMGSLKILAKSIAKKFTKTVLKRLPIIGGLIGLYYAYTEFKNGNITKGFAELISALLNFIPGIGFMLSIGADLLIAWADSKGMFDEGGALSPENGWNTLKSWMGIIGKTIMDNALYLPIIGTFKRLGMAYDAFETGDISEGLKQIGLGMITFFPGGGALIKGMEVLAGWMSASKEPEGKFNKDNSWMGRMKKWIVSKLNDLPEVLKVPLRWFGIIDDESKMDAEPMIQGVKDGSKGIMDYVGGIWDKISPNMGKAVDSVSSFAQDVWQNTKDFSNKAWEKAKEAGSWFKDSIHEMATKTKTLVNDWIPKIIETITDITDTAMSVLKNIASKIGGWIANLFTPDDEKNIQNVSNNLKEKEVIFKQDDRMGLILSKQLDLSKEWLKDIHLVAVEQTRLLSLMLNTENASLRELQRISGNGGKSNTNIITTPTQPSKNSIAPIGSNRSAYATSPYALS